MTWYVRNEIRLLLGIMEKGRTNGMSQGLLDRLLLTEDRIAQIAEGL